MKNLAVYLKQAAMDTSLGNVLGELQTAAVALLNICSQVIEYQQLHCAAVLCYNAESNITAYLR